jgi:hypothetical protein
MTITASDSELPLTTAQPKRLKRSVEDWVAEISGLVAKQRLSVFEIGDVLLQAEAGLSKKSFGNVVKLSGIRSKQNAKNYMRVAGEDNLRRPGILEHLPVTVGALIDLAAWSTGEIDSAIREGILHPQSERAKLRQWRKRRWQTPRKKPEASAKVVGYIMCDAKTYNLERTEEFWKQFDEINLTFLDGDMFIAPYKDDVHSYHRLEMLAKRVWDAYKQDPALFVDPRFHKLVAGKALDEDMLPAYLVEAAPLFASGDHIDLHRLIKFSKSDWKFLKVQDVGYATLLPYLVETA